jgi:glycosyltransferase involved in cell wall biosynthesis
VSDGADIVVKVDGDGQMSPLLIPRIIAPIVRGEADYVKGNRFFRLEGVRSMPLVRIIGNAGLSFLTKLSTGYWSLFDPTNGFTAIHADAVRMLPLDKIRKCYFFESDILFRLNTIRAVVREVPMDAVYGDERSSLSIVKTLFAFPARHAANFAKRLFYNYFLRNFSLASVHLVLGVLLLAFGGYVGVTQWIHSNRTGVPASAGTVMLAGLPILVSLQLILNFIGFDMAGEPVHPIQNRAAE